MLVFVRFDSRRSDDRCLSFSPLFSGFPPLENNTFAFFVIDSPRILLRDRCSLTGHIAHTRLLTRANKMNATRRYREIFRFGFFIVFSPFFSSLVFPSILGVLQFRAIGDDPRLVRDFVAIRAIGNDWKSFLYSGDGRHRNVCCVFSCTINVLEQLHFPKTRTMYVHNAVYVYVFTRRVTILID